MNYNGIQDNLIPNNTPYKNYPRKIVIAINDFSLEIYPEDDHFHESFSYRSLLNPEIRLSNSSQIHILDIPKWEKQNLKLSVIDNINSFSNLDFWMAFFSDKITYEEIKIMAQINQGINEAKSKLDNFMQNDLFLNAYDQADEAEIINTEELSFAEDEGIKIGIQQRNYEFVSTLFKKNVPIDKIMEYTDLSLNEVNEIIESLKK
ncbi:MAG: Rpn family recombination-promoting nuclease/putative transposase [Desulfovibrionaceae bacterium]|nr:Rpn family recombination-promoting nuclease/putative transposase [Desulfovibrionaceae bacterium]